MTFSGTEVGEIRQNKWERRSNNAWYLHNGEGQLAQRKAGWTYVVSMFFPVTVEYSKYWKRLNVLNFLYTVNRTKQEVFCKP